MRLPLLHLVLILATGVPSRAAGDKDVAGGLQLPTNKASTATQTELFEREVRPILVGACFKCHAVGTRSKNGLQLDSLAGLLRGGKRGPAIVPGKPDESLLVRVIRQAPESSLKMPPDGRLAEDQIESISRWIEQGAVWPKETKDAVGDMVVEHRAATWALEPLRVPAIPQVRDQRWAQTPIDRFVLSNLESVGLAPTAPADKPTLLRRVTFDLIGLPPTPEEAENFIKDNSNEAFAKVVERLLKSPHYGERWGRHWLDLVRFSETNGLDFDTDKPGAFHYRDYVIEAFNDDLPYDQFVREHLAGDVLPRPRISRDGSRVNSPIGTGFFWFGEMLEEDNDPVAEAGNEIENQIDVLSKCFLGMTIACARCHDHKFDPIRQSDYNAIASALIHSSNIVACLDTAKSVEKTESTLQQIKDLKCQLRDLVGPVAQQEFERVSNLIADTDQVPAYLLAARGLIGEGKVDTTSIEHLARKMGLESPRLQRWLEAIIASSDDRGDPLYPWAALTRFSDAEFKKRAKGLHRSIERNLTAATILNDEPRQSATPANALFAEFDSDFGDWTALGVAFAAGPARRPEGYRGPGGRGFASSYLQSDALVGQLVSRRFKIEKPFLNVQISGGNQPGLTEVHLVMLHHAVPVRLPGKFATGDGQPKWSRKSIDVSRYIGREAVIVITDNSRGAGGHIMVDEISMSDLPDPPGPTAPKRANSIVLSWLIDPAVDSADALARQYRDLFVDTLRTRQADLKRYAELVVADPNAADVTPPETVNSNADRAFLELWVQQHLDLFASRPSMPKADMTGSGADPGIAEVRLRRTISELEQTLGQSTLALISSEAPRLNMAIHFPTVDDEPNSFFAACSAPSLDVSSPGHGRLALANWIASRGNPLTARVLVNRVWQHHFGRGIVESSDNFGMLGDRPSHPELLDWLAQQFVASGWSIKQLHRLMLLTNTYQQDSQATIKARTNDPQNRLLHSMSVRRLEGECIRDAILAVSGTLNRQLGGPSVPLYISPDMRGDDLPKISGPRDGDCRRSIYLIVRRNHSTPLLGVFDFPSPDRCIGRRDTSIVPSQALYLMNDAFVSVQARLWAKRLLAQPYTDSERLRRIYQEAFTRLPDVVEVERALEFLAAQRKRYHALPRQRETAEIDAWSDLCHLMYNLGEFRFVR